MAVTGTLLVLLVLLHDWVNNNNKRFKAGALQARQQGFAAREQAAVLDGRT